MFYFIFFTEKGEMTDFCYSVAGRITTGRVIAVARGLPAKW